MKSFIDQLRWLFDPKDKRKFISITFLMALSALLELLGISILLGAAAVFLSPQSEIACRTSQIMAALLPGIPERYHIALAIAAIGILLAAKNIFAAWIVSLQSRFIFAKRNELAKRLFKTYLSADYETFFRLSNDYCFSSFNSLTEMGNLVLLPSMQVLADVMVIAILTFAAVYLYPVISLSGIGFMLLTALTVSTISGRANKKYGRQLLEYSLIESRMRQTGICGKKTISCAAKSNFFLEKFVVSHQNLNDIYRKLYNLGQLPRLSLESASVLLAGGVFAVMILLEVPHSEIMLTFAILTAVIGRILPAISRCHYNLTLIKQNHTLFDSIADELFDIIPEKLNSDGTGADASKEICFKNVSFSYSPEQPVLSSVNLTLPPGSTTGIAGRSGRGKTTLVDLLLGLLTPDSGVITAGGIDIYCNLKHWRSRIGYVPQNVFLFEGPIRENVALGEAPEDIDDAKVIRALQQAQLYDFCTDLNAVIHTNGANISGGQRQRIGIARALYREPALLILDEATSALDSETENAFCDTLNELRGKMTILVISHRETTLKNCETVIHL